MAMLLMELLLSEVMLAIEKCEKPPENALTQRVYD
jgi:hypothetical protein